MSQAKERASRAKAPLGEDQRSAAEEAVADRIAKLTDEKVTDAMNEIAAKTGEDVAAKQGELAEKMKEAGVQYKDEAVALINRAMKNAKGRDKKDRWSRILGLEGGEKSELLEKKLKKYVDENIADLKD